MTSQAPGLKESAAVLDFEARHAQWQAQLPKAKGALWDHLASMDPDSQMQLFAHLAAATVNVLREPWDRRPGAIAHGNVVARDVGLDMVAAGWTPTVDNYLGRVPKARILEAVREGCGEKEAQLIDHLKKGDMAREAERLLADSGWLPEPLRLPEIDAISVEAEDGTATASCRTSTATRTASRATTTSSTCPLSSMKTAPKTRPRQTTSTSSPPNKVHSPPHESPAPRRASAFSTPSRRSKTMADYFTHFSCTLDVVTADNAARALELYRQFSDELEIEEQTPGFDLVATPTAKQPALLWIYDDNASGDTDHVLAFVSKLGPMLGITGLWGFEWAHTCSRPRLDAFGGGALVIDLASGETLGTISSNEWLTRTLADPDTAGEA